MAEQYSVRLEGYQPEQGHAAQGVNRTTTTSEKLNTQIFFKIS